VGIIHQSKLVQELDMTELERLSQKRLAVNGPDHKAIQARLHALGFNSEVSASGWVEVSDQRAVRHPEDIARTLVEDGIKLTMIKTDEENLEHYFLRIIGEGQTGHETIITNS
jgi:ABC-2 type transport system ATP-binding protein